MTKDLTPVENGMMKQGPREKLKRSGNPEELSDEELLAILLKTGAKGCDVWELSHRLLQAFDSLYELVHANARTIETKICNYNKVNPERMIKGVGNVKLLQLQAAFELSRRARRLQEEELRSKNVRSSSAAYQIFRKFADSEPWQESFFVLPVDSDYHPLCNPIRISTGTADMTIVHPRDIFREAISWNAHSLIIAHNHPCGDPTPSETDIKLTERLLEVSRIHGIPILDHIVLGSVLSERGKGFVSIRNLAVLKF